MVTSPTLLVETPAPYINITVDGSDTLEKGVRYTGPVIVKDQGLHQIKARIGKEGATPSDESINQVEVGWISPRYVDVNSQGGTVSRESAQMTGAGAAQIIVSHTEVFGDVKATILVPTHGSGPYRAQDNLPINFTQGHILYTKDGLTLTLTLTSLKVTFYTQRTARTRSLTVYVSIPFSTMALIKK